MSSGPIGNQGTLPLWTLIERHIFYFSGTTAERPRTTLCFSRPIGKSRWPLWPVIGWAIFDFFATTEQISSKLDRKQDLNNIKQVCVFFLWSIGKPRWPSKPMVGWDILDFLSATAEQNKAKLDRKLDLNVLHHVCVFRTNRKNQEGCHGLWLQLAETFSTSSLEPMNWIWWHLARSKNSISLTNFVFFLSIEN